MGIRGELSMEVYKIEGKVNEVRMHTLSVNGAPCIIVVDPDGRIEVTAMKITSAEAKPSKASKPRQRPAQAPPIKAPVANTENPMQLSDRLFNMGRAFMANKNPPVWMR
jgi:hypothetical protein